MAGAVSKDKYSTQTIQNFGFDEKYKIPIRLFYGYDEAGDRLIPFKVDENGNLYALPLPSGAATSANQSTIISNLQALNSLIPSVYDYISLSYDEGNLSEVVFKTGGSGGTTVSTLTLAYSGSDLISVTKT